MQCPQRRVPCADSHSPISVAFSQPHETFLVPALVLTMHAMADGSCFCSQGSVQLVLEL